MAFYVLLSSQVFIIVFWYYVFTPTMRPCSNVSISSSIAILACMILLFGIATNSIKTQGVPTNTLFYIIGLSIGPIWIVGVNNWLYRKIDVPKLEIPSLSALLHQFGFRATVVRLDDDYNAMVSGISRNNPLIGFSDSLAQKLSTEDITSILLHETGHARRGHISAVMLLSICIAFINIQWVYTYPKTVGIWEPVAVIFAECAKTTLLLRCLYFLEYDADLFAAKIVGQERYVSMLKNLDLATNGKLSQGDFVHPRLNKRIAYVKKHLP